MRKVWKAVKWLWRKLRNGHKRFWRWYRGLYKGRPWWVKILSALGTLVVVFIIYVLMVMCNFL
ncbi:MAG: hypothetical protein J6X70_05420 [Muribaculaceae bacterium]|nr:hypothetical protein [Muribaculaceae bacterium]